MIQIKYRQGFRQLNLDTVFKKEAFAAFEDAFGPCGGWGKLTRNAAYNFLLAVDGLTPSTLTLSSLKESLSRFKREHLMHRAAYLFLQRIKSIYCADDAKEFRKIMHFLASAGRSFVIIFKTDVRSFKDIVTYDYYGERNFYVIRTKSEGLRPLYWRFITKNVWHIPEKPSQKNFDYLFSLVDQIIGHPAQPSDISVDLFFSIVDILKAKVTEGSLSKKEHRGAIYILIYFYRYCIRHEGNVIPDAPFSDLKIFLYEETITFFISGYISRDRTFFFHYYGKATGRLVTINIDNPDVRAAYGYLLRSGRIACDEFRACCSTLEESLGEHARIIGRGGHWDESVLMGQIEFYRRLYANNAHRSESISFVKKLYISIDEQSNGAFFKNAVTLSYSLLTSHQFIKYCDEGFEFRLYSQYDNVTKGKKIVFIVKNFNRYSKRYLKEDHISVDFSTIHNPFYRSLAWKSITSKPNRLYRKMYAYTLRDMLPMLTLLKHQAGWISPDLCRFTMYDAIQVRLFFETKTKCNLTYNSYIINVRDFLRWASLSKEIAVDDIAMTILSNKKESVGITNTPVIPEADFTALCEWFAERARADTDYAQAFILMNICTITPLRIGHACFLCLKELVYDNKLDSYVVMSLSKGTRGNVGEIVLGQKANLFIRKAIAIMDKISNVCTQESLREHLFLYCSKGMYHVWSPHKFGVFLAEACNECNLPHYTAKNLRATYMTHAYIAACENGEVNDFLLKLFSYHRNRSTTLEHYVNHDEALAALTDSLKAGRSWEQTSASDERNALEATIEDYNTLLDRLDDEDAKAVILEEMDVVRQRLESITDKI